jgi:cytochrome P450
MTESALLEPLPPQPAHVTDSVFYDFDMFRDPAFLEDPHTRILDLHRDAPPVFWTPRNGGHWMLISHRANFEAARDPETFSSQMIPQVYIEQMLAAMPAGSERIPQPYPISLDPPQHAIYRAPLQRAFSPKAMAALSDRIRALAAQLIDKIKPLGETEFVSSVAETMPVQVFLQMFGLPLRRQAEYRELVKEQLAVMEHGIDEVVSRLVRVARVMRDTLLERREHPADDLISLLWRSKIGERETVLGDLEDFSVLLFIAGLDTVMNGIGHGVIHLARNPQLQRQLRENSGLISQATEELLRRYTFTVPPRRLAKDTVFMGVEMKQDDRAMLFLPAADLDRNEYPEPDRYNLEREKSVHIAFGAGPHRCLGSHLARLELVIFYEELLKRLPEFRLDPTKPLRYHGGHVIGPDAIHLQWDA